MADAELIDKPQVTSGDLDYIKTAVRRGWVFPENYAKIIPYALMEVLMSKEDPTNPSSDYKHDVKHRIKAAQVLKDMHGQNIAADPPPQDINLHVSTRVDRQQYDLLTEDEKRVMLETYNKLQSAKRALTNGSR